VKLEIYKITSELSEDADYHFLMSLILEIQTRLILAGKAYFSLLGVMRCKDIHKKTKVKLYKTLIRTVLTYGSETWTLSKIQKMF
jgi:hypothetical protein